MEFIFSFLSPPNFVSVLCQFYKINNLPLGSFFDCKFCAIFQFQFFHFSLNAQLKLIFFEKFESRTARGKFFLLHNGWSRRSKACETWKMSQFHMKENSKNARLACWKWFHALHFLFSPSQSAHSSGFAVSISKKNSITITSLTSHLWQKRGNDRMIWSLEKRSIRWRHRKQQLCELKRKKKLHSTLQLSTHKRCGLFLFGVVGGTLKPSAGTHDFVVIAWLIRLR